MIKHSAAIINEIYPKCTVNMVKDSKLWKCTISTYVRVNVNERWILVPVVTSGMSSSHIHAVTDTFQFFVKDVYDVLVFGGEGEQDLTQISEKMRLNVFREGKEDS